MDFSSIKTRGWRSPVPQKYLHVMVNRWLISYGLNLLITDTDCWLEERKDILEENKETHPLIQPAYSDMLNERKYLHSHQLKQKV